MNQSFFFKEPKEKYNNINNTISFQTDKMLYFPDETINGIIFLNISNIISFEDISIYLEHFQGWTINDNIIKHSIICEMDLNLNAQFFQQTEKNLILQPGKYSFLFCLKIPNYIDPSFEYSYHHQIAFSRYTLGTKIKTKKNLKNKGANKVIQIGSQYKEISSQEKIMEVSKPIQTFWKNKGICKLIVSSEEICVKYNDTIKINIFINNENCSSAAKSLRITLYREVTLYKANKEKHKRIKNKMYHKEKEINVYKSFQEFKEFISINEDNTSFNYTTGFKEQYHFINNFSELLVSIKTDLMECDYYLEIQVSCGGYTVEAKLPIIVVNQNLEEKENLQSRNNQQQNNPINEIQLLSNNSQDIYSIDNYPSLSEINLHIDKNNSFEENNNQNEQEFPNVPDIPIEQNNNEPLEQHFMMVLNS